MVIGVAAGATEERISAEPTAAAIDAERKAHLAGPYECARYRANTHYSAP